MLTGGTNQGLTIWLTGLSGAGKSTLAQLLKNFIEEHFNRKTVILDGDKIRKGVNEGLAFSQEDRAQNIRVSEIAKLFNQEGVICIVACISPYRSDRKKARLIHENQSLRFIECYINCSLEECQKRDPKGFYKKAREGLIKQFTGISDPYEAPEIPELVISTDQLNLKESLQKLQQFVCQNYFCEDLNEGQIVIYQDYVCDFEELSLLQVFQQGWTEVDSFMNYKQILQSIYFKNYTKTNRVTVFQPIPIFLLVSEKIAKTISKDSSLKVRFIDPKTNSIIAVLHNPLVQEFRHEQFSSKLFGTHSQNHPKIGEWLKKGNYILSGSELTFKCQRIYMNDGLDRYRKDVKQLKKQLQDTKSDCVFAFQLRNPLHNGHLFLLKKAQQNLLKRFKKPVLLIHPCGGWVKDDDVPLHVRIHQHQVLIKQSQIFNSTEIILAIWPSPMYYAGPLEVLWHIKSRQMLEVQFMVVGRDPAGVKHPDNSKLDLYEAHDGHRVIEIARNLGFIKTQIIPFKMISWNKKKQQLMEYDEKDKEDFEMISGTQMRQMAKNNEQVPEWFMNRESWHILRDFYQNLK